MFCDPMLFFQAPNGCLQFYMEASGQIQGFNYKTEVTNNQPNQIANLNYAICMRMESGFCGIRYSQVKKKIFRSYRVNRNT